MDRAAGGTQFLALRVAGLGGAMAVSIAIAVFASGAPTTQAVEQLQAPAPTVEASGASSGNGPTGYFPDQFANQASKVTEHIEAS